MKIKNTLIITMSGGCLMVLCCSVATHAMYQYRQVQKPLMTKEQLDRVRNFERKKADIRRDLNHPKHKENFAEYIEALKNIYVPGHEYYNAFNEVMKEMAAEQQLDQSKKMKLNATRTKATVAKDTLEKKIADKANAMGPNEFFVYQEGTANGVIVPLNVLMLSKTIKNMITDMTIGDNTPKAIPLPFSLETIKNTFEYLDNFKLRKFSKNSADSLALVVNIMNCIDYLDVGYAKEIDVIQFISDVMAKVVVHDIDVSEIKKIHESLLLLPKDVDNKIINYIKHQWNFGKVNNFITELLAKKDRCQMFLQVAPPRRENGTDFISKSQSTIGLLKSVSDLEDEVAHWESQRDEKMRGLKEKIEQSDRPWYRRWFGW